MERKESANWTETLKLVRFQSCTNTRYFTDTMVCDWSWNDCATNSHDNLRKNCHVVRAIVNEFPKCSVQSTGLPLRLSILADHTLFPRSCFGNHSTLLTMLHDSLAFLCYCPCIWCCFGVELGQHVLIRLWVIVLLLSKEFKWLVHPCPRTF